jgi:NAD(P)H-hydrate epimerase
MSESLEKITTIPTLPARASDTHKGDVGKLLILAGSIGMTGAPALAGKAALRSGAGLVRIATAQSALPIVASLDPCYTTLPLAEDQQGRISAKAIAAVMNALQEHDVMALGPGLGISRGLTTLIVQLLNKTSVPIVLDADGINNLCQRHDWPEQMRTQVVMTPHPGEMRRLWANVRRDSPPADRQQCAVTLAAQTRTVMVLKGEHTVVSDGRRVYINQTGNPGMATAGSGDVLTGIITALIGQGLALFDAAVLGVAVHGFAGDMVAERSGMISLVATDIIDMLGPAFERIHTLNV